MTEESEEARRVRPFADWLQEQRQGVLATELGDALNALVDAVHTHGKQGTLTLRLTVKPASTNAPMVTVIDEVVLKTPEPERPGVIYFIDDESNLSRANPAQPALPLREVAAPDTTTAKEASSQ